MRTRSGQCSEGEARARRRRGGRYRGLERRRRDGPDATTAGPSRQRSTLPPPACLPARRAGHTRRSQSLRPSPPALGCLRLHSAVSASTRLALPALGCFRGAPAGLRDHVLWSSQGGKWGRSPVFSASRLFSDTCSSLQPRVPFSFIFFIGGFSVFLCVELSFPKSWQTLQVREPR